MSTREIAEHVGELYGAETSPDPGERGDRRGTRAFRYAASIINRSSYVPVYLHALHPLLSDQLGRRHLLPDFYSGATGLSGRFAEGFSLRRLHGWFSRLQQIGDQR